MGATAIISLLIALGRDGGKAQQTQAGSWADDKMIYVHCPGSFPVVSVAIDVGAVASCVMNSMVCLFAVFVQPPICAVNFTRICVISSPVIFRCSQTATNLQLIAKRARDVSRRGFLEEITFSLRFHVACENTKKETKTQMNNLLSQS